MVGVHVLELERLAVQHLILAVFEQCGGNTPFLRRLVRKQTFRCSIHPYGIYDLRFGEHHDTHTFDG